MSNKNAFSLNDFYKELIFTDINELHDLWREFSCESELSCGSLTCEKFYHFIRKNMEKYNSLLDILKKKISSDINSFRETLVEYYNFTERKKLKNIKKRLVDEAYSSFNQGEINKCTFNNFDDMIKYYKKIYVNLPNETELPKDYNEYHYVYYSIIILLFGLVDGYKTLKQKFTPIPKQNKLTKFYQSKKLNLLEVDDQYKKYDLLSISSGNFELCGDQPFQLKDKRIESCLYFSDLIPNKYSAMRNGHLSLKEFLWQYLEINKIKKLSLRPDFEKVPADGLSVSFEEFEIGIPFEIKGLNEKNVAKLFQSHNYDNQLWVYRDAENNITFEEFNDEEYEDYFSISGYRVSNVIHLKYLKEKEKYFIHHLDHEYIFYTQEEYEKRKRNYLQKGNARKRIKTFKIDDSKIPLNTKADLIFLETILKECLSHVDLIEEYLGTKAPQQS